MEEEALILRELLGGAYKLFRGLEGEFIRRSYLALAQETNPEGILVDRSAIQEEYKLIKTFGYMSTYFSWLQILDGKKIVVLSFSS